MKKAALNSFKHIFLFFLIIFSFGQISAQDYKYFKQETFISDLKNYLKPYFKNKPDFKQEFDNFENKWVSGQLDELKFGIVFVLNRMREQLYKPYPDYYYYFRVLNFLVDTGKVDFYLEWEAGLSAAIDGGIKRKTADYLQISSQFICDGILFSKGPIKWRVKTESFSIEVDPVKDLTVNFYDGLDLILTDDIDTEIIYNTRGVCYPTKGIWKGSDGYIYYNTSDSADKSFDKGSYIAIKGDYMIDMKNSSFKINDVYLYYPDYNLYHIKGNVEVKLHLPSPSFISFDQYELNLFDNRLYTKGYVALTDKNFSLISDVESFIPFIFKYKDGTTFIQGKTKKADIFKNRFLAQNSAVSINIGGDSIVNYSATFEYNEKLDLNFYSLLWFDNDSSLLNYPVVAVYTNESGSIGNSFIDFYHQLEFYVSDMLWFLDDDKLYFLNTRRTLSKKALFFSYRFFDPRLYKKLDAGYTSTVNFIRVLAKYYDNGKNRYITEDQFIDLLMEYDVHLSSQSVFSIWQILEKYSFIIVNYDKKVAYITPRVLKYQKYYEHKESMGREGEDYDLISLTASPENEYGVVSILYLNDKDKKFEIKNPSQFALSRPQQLDTLFLRNTIVYPDSSLIIYKNLNMRFKGKVYAGLYTFEGNNFYFNYDSFRVNIVDTNTVLKLSYISNKNEIVSISTAIHNVRGTIFVNAPDNKSTDKILPEYPKIKIPKSKIDYEKSKFTFDLYKIQEDSLNFITEDNLRFSGDLNTNILPKMKNVKLTVKDYNKKKKVAQLGFIKCDFKRGFPLNKDSTLATAYLYGCIKLRDKGLSGQGIILQNNAVYKGSFEFKKGSLSGSIDNFYMNYFDTTNLKSNTFNFAISDEVKDEKFFDKYLLRNLKTNELLYLDEFKTGAISVDTIINRYMNLHIYSSDKKKQKFVNVCKTTPYVFMYGKDKVKIDFSYTDEKENVKFHKTKLKIYSPYLKRNIPRFSGNFYYKDGELYGNGALVFPSKVEIKGRKEFKFSRYSITNQSVKFGIFEIKDKKKVFVFKADSLSAFLNISSKRQGIFTSKNPKVLYFYKNYYKAFSNRFVWDMNLKKLSFGIDTTKALEASAVNLEPLKPEIGPKLTGKEVYYSYENSDLNVFLRSKDTIFMADALFVPYENTTLVIKEKAKFLPINAKHLHFFAFNQTKDSLTGKIHKKRVDIHKFYNVSDIIISSNVNYSTKTAHKIIKGKEVVFYKIFYNGQKKESFALSNFSDVLDINSYFQFRGVGNPSILIRAKYQFPFFTGNIVLSLAKDKDGFFVKNYILRGYDNDVYGIDTSLNRNLLFAALYYSKNQRKKDKLQTVILTKKRLDADENSFIYRLINQPKNLKTNKFYITFDQKEGFYKISSDTNFSLEVPQIVFNNNFEKFWGRFDLNNPVIDGLYIRSVVSNDRSLTGVMYVDLNNNKVKQDFIKNVLFASYNFDPELTIIRNNKAYKKYVTLISNSQIAEKFYADSSNVNLEKFYLKKNKLVFANITLTYKFCNEQGPLWFTSDGSDFILASYNGVSIFKNFKTDFNANPDQKNPEQNIVFIKQYDFYIKIGVKSVAETDILDDEKENEKNYTIYLVKRDDNYFQIFEGVGGDVLKKYKLSNSVMSEDVKGSLNNGFGYPLIIKCIKKDKTKE